MLFKDERFGMFIHFGLYAQNGWHEQEMWRRRVPKEEYVPLARTFCPRKGCAEEWVKAAKEAGMQYICFTTKHHDGFCLWDTKYTDYNIMNTPYGSDLLAEVAEACHRHGLLLELYYSQPDWHYPLSVNLGGDHQLDQPNAGDTPDEEGYKDYIRNQIRELLTGYGPIAALFWDIPPATVDPSINELARSLMPGILINDRGYDKGDYSTPERHVPDGAFSRLTEGCQSVGAESWGYRKNEDYFTAGHLSDSIDRIMSRGGNYLLNVGPDGNGEIPEESGALLKKVGNFYGYAKESYLGCETVGSRPYPITRKGNVLYVHLPAAFVKTGLSLAPLSTMPQRVSVLGWEHEVKWELAYLPTAFRQKDPLPGEMLHVWGLPTEENAGYPTVLRLEFEDIAPVLEAFGGKESAGQVIL